MAHQSKTGDAVSSMVIFVSLFLLWIVLCALAGKFAASKGRSAAFWFVASILISPLISALLIELGGRVGNATLRSCPDCREMVKHDAIKCKHCGATLTPVAPV